MARDKQSKSEERETRAALVVPMMNQKTGRTKSLAYLVAVSTAGISLWLTATISLSFNYSLRDCLVFLILISGDHHNRSMP